MSRPKQNTLSQTKNVLRVVSRRRSLDKSNHDSNTTPINRVFYHAEYYVSTLMIFMYIFS